MKYIYLIFGFICFGLGAIGTFLPILPTTPFLLVASFCFAKGSKRFNDWFCNTSIYKKYLQEFVQKKSMPAKTKAVLLISVSLLLMVPFILVNNFYMRSFLVFIIALKYYYFLCKVKTSPSNNKITKKID